MIYLWYELTSILRLSCNWMIAMPHQMERHCLGESYHSLGYLLILRQWYAWRWHFHFVTTNHETRTEPTTHLHSYKRIHFHNPCHLIDSRTDITMNINYWQYIVPPSLIHNISTNLPPHPNHCRFFRVIQRHHQNLTIVSSVCLNELDKLKNFSTNP